MVMYRSDLENCKRIIVKVGTATITNEDGTIALGRVGDIVEQISRLMAQGKEVILVSSGSVGVGSRHLKKQAFLSASMRDHVNPSTDIDMSTNLRAQAAAGQAGLMLLYDILFRNFDIQVAQVLVTDSDFLREVSRNNFKRTVRELVAHSIIPIINENDVVSLRSTPLRDENNMIFWDNDSLAALIGAELDADLICLLTDVAGLYTSNPKTLKKGEKLEVIDVYRPSLSVTMTGKSRVGRGGMEAKVRSAMGAVEKGVPAVVIASGSEKNVVERIIKGEKLGTLFVRDPPPLAARASVGSSKEENQAALQANAARAAARSLLSLSSEERANILRAIADALLEHSVDILTANELDMNDSLMLAVPMRNRLHLTKSKLETVCNGIRQIADYEEPVGAVLRKTELAENLTLTQETVPIGVLLVIFESRPDALPQIAALALRTCNGLVLKGGKEADRTNTSIHRVLTETIEKASNGRVSRDVVGLVHSREEISALLTLKDEIDLIIPRGSNQLVSHIQANTRIPVLGHADGVCHVYVDQHANIAKAIRILLDSKTDSPSACNAVETVLLHRSLLPQWKQEILPALVAKKVRVYAGPLAATLTSGLPIADSMSAEFGDLELNFEIVDDVQGAIAHINEFSSHHTDAIVTEDSKIASEFQLQVDSGCVFHNASTRFSDGFRFGLGAEVGISTGKIHARGPVGIDGLLSTQWKLTSTSETGDIAADFTNKKRVFTHKNLLKARL